MTILEKIGRSVHAYAYVAFTYLFIGGLWLGFYAGAADNRESMSELSYGQLILDAAVRETGYTEQQVRESNARLANMRKDN